MHWCIYASLGLNELTPFGGWEPWKMLLLQRRDQIPEIAENIYCQYKYIKRWCITCSGEQGVCSFECYVRVAFRGPTQRRKSTPKCPPYRFTNKSSWTSITFFKFWHNKSGDQKGMIHTSTHVFCMFCDDVTIDRAICYEAGHLRGHKECDI